jgi:hypothetical protein|uniref:Uncharacterized protein n=1 Tax=Picea glauca TaxID=3330 RepID=A0A101M4I5_PICGL|nr:hypothetical protein ABT39_MTgene606 [Picea glauca]
MDIFFLDLISPSKMEGTISPLRPDSAGKTLQARLGQASRKARTMNLKRRAHSPLGLS